MFFAESHDGACADTMSGFGGIGKPVSCKRDLSFVWIGDLKHEFWLVDALDNDLPLVFWEFLTGIYGIF